MLCAKLGPVLSMGIVAITQLEFTASTSTNLRHATFFSVQGVADELYASPLRLQLLVHSASAAFALQLILAAYTKKHLRYECQMLAELFSGLCVFFSMLRVFQAIFGPDIGQGRKYRREKLDGAQAV
jgi:hypothetical protein